MKQATLMFLVDGGKVLLAMKKRGFGVGRWNGVGGKVKDDESIEEAAIRECQEEIIVTPVNLTKAAVINFYFPKEKSDWNQEVTTYLCNKWSGEPAETEEMSPKWFDINKIPFKDMWASDKYWLSKALKGDFIKADIYFDDNDQVIKQRILATARANEI